mgnify:CR=1 FL=1
MLASPNIAFTTLILALAGLKRVLTKAKFTTSSRVQNQLEEYEENNNPIIGFVQEIGMFIRGMIGTPKGLEYFC